MTNIELKDGAASDLQTTVRCPHCWHIFPPDQTLWVSVHPDLRGDERLGDELKRFLPTRFSPEALALDMHGQHCRENACPHCHLSITRASLELPPTIVSIIGSPGSGKSYFLASMIRQMRSTLPHRFFLDFTDADMRCNIIINQNEQALFMRDSEDDLVQIRKTQMSGDLYDTVSFANGRRVSFSKPFLFTVKPSENHPEIASSNKQSRLVVLYDNAGEHFRPDENHPDQPGTEHLAHAQVLMFLFDPTQHPQFRRSCHAISNDPQLGDFGRVYDQVVVLNEAAARIRQWTGMRQDQKDKRPLIVLVTKHDIWGPLIKDQVPVPLTLSKLLLRSQTGRYWLNIDELTRVSEAIKGLLKKKSPEIVAAAQSLAEKVLYVPVSATGCSPIQNERPGVDGLYVRNGDIKPTWVEIPLIYALQRTSRGLITAVKVKNA
ncbi:hypothetical protein GC170_22505 [bacterium]|nr:hypothetical protein [bacterium]